MLKKLVRSRRVQERELRRGWRHGERRAAGAAAVSGGTAKLRATSDVSSQKSLNLCHPTLSPHSNTCHC